VGVPVITHEVVLRDKPVGSAGLTLHEVGAPPVFVGVIVPTLIPLVKMNGLPANPSAGVASFTVALKVAVPVPAVLVAVTV
jgi:hypothetical protein